jgi:hypothetical protein
MRLPSFTAESALNHSTHIYRLTSDPGAAASAERVIPQDFYLWATSTLLMRCVPEDIGLGFRCTLFRGYAM